MEQKSFNAKAQIFLMFFYFGVISFPMYQFFQMVKTVWINAIAYNYSIPQIIMLVLLQILIYFIAFRLSIKLVFKNVVTGDDEKSKILLSILIFSIVFTIGVGIYNFYEYSVVHDELDSLVMWDEIWQGSEYNYDKSAYTSDEIQKISQIQSEIRHELEVIKEESIFKAILIIALLLLGYCITSFFHTKVLYKMDNRGGNW